MNVEIEDRDEEEAALGEELLRRKVAGYTPDQVQAVILAAERLANEVEDLLFAVVDERAQRQKVRDAWQNYVETADRS